MTITLTREEAQQVLDALEAEHSAIYGTSQTVKATELLRTRLAQPEPERKWEPQIERKYSPDGVLLSEKIKYTPDGEWQDLKQYPVAWWYDMGDVIDLNVSGRGTPLYFAPPQREWQGLTDEEIRNEAKNHVFDESFFSGAIWARGQIMRKNNG